MKCPNCKCEWIGVQGLGSVTIIGGYCGRCGAGPYIADTLELYKDVEKAEVARRKKRAAAGI